MPTSEHQKEWEIAALYQASKQASFDISGLQENLKRLGEWAKENPELTGAATGALAGGLTTGGLRGALLGGIGGAGLGAGYRGLEGDDLEDKWNTLSRLILNKTEPAPTKGVASNPVDVSKINVKDFNAGRLPAPTPQEPSDYEAYKAASFGKNLVDAGKSIAKTVKENDVARRTAIAAGLGAAGLGALGYGAHKATQTPDEEEQAAIDADPSLSKKQKREAKKSWVQRHPWLTAGALAGLGGAGLYGAAKFTDWKNSDRGSQAWQGMKDTLADNGLEDNPIARKLGLRLADFRPDRMDKSVFNETHAPGQISKATWEKIKKDGKLTMSDIEVLKEKTGMSDKDAKKYLESVRNSRTKSDLQNSLSGYIRVNPARRTTFYSDAAQAAADPLMQEFGMTEGDLKNRGAFSLGHGYRVGDNGGMDIDDFVWTPKSLEEFSETAKGIDPMAMKMNGLANKNVKGDGVKLMTPESVAGHEASHGSNWHRPNPTRDRYRPDVQSIINAMKNGTAVKAQRGEFTPSSTDAMDRLQDAFLNGVKGSGELGDYTYPIYDLAEGSQVLNTLKQQAIALNGGKAPITERGWRKALEHLALTTPTTGEQYRFQSYITPQDADEVTALATRKQVLDKILNELYRKDSKGINTFNQLGSRRELTGK